MTKGLCTIFGKNTNVFGWMIALYLEENFGMTMFVRRPIRVETSLFSWAMHDLGLHYSVATIMCENDSDMENHRK